MKVSRKTREGLTRRRELLTAAEVLFAKNGFFKTTMADIAEEAEFAIGTLYQMFKSKEEIYLSLVNEKVTAYLSEVEAETSTAVGGGAKIEALIRTKLNFFEHNRNFFRIYVAEWSGFEWAPRSAFGDRIWKKLLAHLDLIAEIIEKGIRTGEFKGIAPKEAAFALNGMMNSTIFHWILGNHPPGSLLVKTEVIKELFLTGIEKPDAVMDRNLIRRSEGGR
jgi:AcrR family transcriptional regulator